MNRASTFRQLSADQWIFFFAIALLGLGGLGGSLQPSRLLSICLLPFVLMNLSVRLGRRGSGLDGRTVGLAIGLVTLAVLSIGWSYMPAQSAGYSVVLTVHMMPLLYLASLRPERRAQLLPVMTVAWFLAMAMTLPVAFYEITTGNHFAYALDGRGSGMLVPLIPYASVFFGNFNDYSLFLTLCVTMLVALTAGTGGSWFNWLIAAGILLAVVVLLFNSSRGAMGATFAVLLIRLATAIGVTRTLGLIAAAGAAMAVLLDFGDSPLMTLLVFKFTDVTDDLTNDDGRVAIMLASLQGIADSYGLGLGADGYSEYFTRYFPNIIPNPHNLVLELALNFSVLGLVIFAAHAILLMWRTYGMYANGAIAGGTLALRVSPLLLLPLMGVVQSHLTGYTYFWYWYVGFVLLSLVSGPSPGTTAAARG